MRAFSPLSVYEDKFPHPHKNYLTWFLNSGTERPREAAFLLKPHCNEATALEPKLPDYEQQHLGKWSGVGVEWGGVEGRGRAPSGCLFTSWSNYSIWILLCETVGLCRAPALNEFHLLKT